MEDSSVRVARPEWYEQNRQFPAGGAPPANGEEAALSRVGPDLYEKIFKHCARTTAPSMTATAMRPEAWLICLPALTLTENFP